MNRRARIDAIARVLRQFQLVDNGNITRIALQGTPARQHLIRQIKSSGLVLPPAFKVEVLADRLLDAMAQADQTQQNIVEISCWKIEQFSAFREVDTSTLTLPLAIPEAAIKSRLNELLGELRSAQDWGGEDNDIFSTAVRVGGREVPAAFLLKGPSVPRPMRLRDCGKNGDQILRLAESPAELFVVQHVDLITEPVRRQLRMNVEALRARGIAANCAFIDGRQTFMLMANYQPNHS